MGHVRVSVIDILTNQSFSLCPFADPVAIKGLGVVSIQMYWGSLDGIHTLDVEETLPVRRRAQGIRATKGSVCVLCRGLQLSF